MGLETWLIHGTFSNSETFSQEFEDAVAEQFNDTTTRFEWSGSNTDAERKRAAKDLANEILEYHEENPNEPINLIGHSHGGNVAILACNILSEQGVQVENLVTLGTPVREYQLVGDNVGSHTQVYNPYDMTQIIGGESVTLPFGIGEGGPSGRLFPDANNIEYSYNASLYNPYTHTFENPTPFFTDNHGVYYQSSDCYNTWLPQVDIYQSDTCSRLGK